MPTVSLRAPDTSEQVSGLPTPHLGVVAAQPEELSVKATAHRLLDGSGRPGFLASGKLRQLPRHARHSVGLQVWLKLPAQEPPGMSQMGPQRRVRRSDHPEDGAPLRRDRGDQVQPRGQNLIHFIPRPEDVQHPHLAQGGKRRRAEGGIDDAAPLTLPHLRVPLFQETAGAGRDGHGEPSTPLRPAT